MTSIAQWQLWYMWAEGRETGDLHDRIVPLINGVLSALRATQLADTQVRKIAEEALLKPEGQNTDCTKGTTSLQELLGPGVGTIGDLSFEICFRAGGDTLSVLCSVTLPPGCPLDKIKLLLSALSGRESTFGRPAVLLQGDTSAPLSDDDVTAWAKDVARTLDVRDAWAWGECALVGTLYQLDERHWLLLAPENLSGDAQDDLHRIVLTSFPAVAVTHAKFLAARDQADLLLRNLRSAADPPPELGENERKEWKECSGLLKRAGDEELAAMRFVVEHAAQIRIVGSPESDTLRQHLTRLRETQARLVRPIVNAERIVDTMEINLESYRQALDRCFQEPTPSPGSLREHAFRLCGNLLLETQHAVRRAKLVLDRNEAVRAVYTEQLQEIRSVQDQREARLQSVQTSLLAAIGAAIGVGQLLQGEGVGAALGGAQAFVTLSVAGLTFLVSHLVFTKDRRNERADYVVGCAVGALVFGTAWLVGPSMVTAATRNAWLPVSTLAGLGVAAFVGAIVGLGAVRLCDPHRRS